MINTLLRKLRDLYALLYNELVNPKPIRRTALMKNRTLLMIPGPIEFEPAVLAALGAPTTSHVAPDFIEVFGQALRAHARGLPLP